MVPAGPLLPLIEHVGPLLVEDLAEPEPVLPQPLGDSDHHLGIVQSCDDARVLGAKQDHSVSDVVVLGLPIQVRQAHVPRLSFAQHVGGFDLDCRGGLQFFRFPLRGLSGSLRVDPVEVALGLDFIQSKVQLNQLQVVILWLLKENLFAG